MDSKGVLMHIDRAHEVAMPAKPADAARPISAFGLVLVPAAGTSATGSSFGAAEARDASLFGFMREVVDVLAVFPQRHTVVMMASFILTADAVRVADEERANLLFNAEVDHLASGFVPQVAHAALGAAADLVFGALELLPAPRVFPAPALLFGELTQLLAALPLEAADALGARCAWSHYCRGRHGQSAAPPGR
jgi:hypothetical protein